MSTNPSDISQAYYWQQFVQQPQLLQQIQIHQLQQPQLLQQVTTQPMAGVMPMVGTAPQFQPQAQLLYQPPQPPQYWQLMIQQAIPFYGPADLGRPIL